MAHIISTILYFTLVLSIIPSGAQCAVISSFDADSDVELILESSIYSKLQNPITTNKNYKTNNSYKSRQYKRSCHASVKQPMNTPGTLCRFFVLRE